MKVWQLALIVFIVFVIYAVIYKTAKKKKPVFRAFLTMMTGVLSLILVDVAGIYTGVYLPVSPLSLAVSATLGVPGVASMIIIGWIL